MPSPRDLKKFEGNVSCDPHKVYLSNLFYVNLFVAGVHLVQPYDTRASPSEGFVEVQIRGSWVSICADNWNSYDATVVCKSLGYDEGETESPSTYGNRYTTE